MSKDDQQVLDGEIGLSEIGLSDDNVLGMEMEDFVSLWPSRNC